METFLFCKGNLLFNIVAGMIAVILLYTLVYIGKKEEAKIYMHLNVMHIHRQMRRRDACIHAYWKRVLISVLL